MDESSTRDYLKLVEFWNGAFVTSDEEFEGASDWNEFVPSRKILDAVQAMAGDGRILDYGCGTGWASIALGKAGCRDVVAVDVAENGPVMTRRYADRFGVGDCISERFIDAHWLENEAAESYDGAVCSNVLDVVPTEVALSIIRNLARVVRKGSTVVIGLNFYLSPERAAEKGVVLEGGERRYVDGILRLVSRTDEKWSDLLGECFSIERLDHFAWPGEEKETRRLFVLKRK